MGERVSMPQYFKIAMDIAARIARGELREGERMYGRSIMSSEYGVSPETIRRALKLLSDMGVVEVRPKSCAVVVSAQEAQTYISRFASTPKVSQLRAELKTLLQEHTALGRRIAETVGEITKADESLAESAPFSNFESVVPETCRVVGKSLGELNFWQTTGATVIAIRRAGSIILSPGPYALLLGSDVLVYVGGSVAVQAVTELLREAQ